MKTPFEETKIGTALSGMIDLLAAGFLWLLCCLPVVTAGPATAAFYYTVVKCVRHERSHVGAAFFGAFKSNFKSALLLWLAFLAYAAVTAADAWAAKLMGSEAGLYAYGFWLLIIPGALVLPWLFAYVSRFENSFGGTVKACFYLSLKNIGNTLILFLILGLFGFIGWLLPQIIILLPGLCCLLMSYQIEPVFAKLVSGMEDNNPDRWYNE